ncbi:MAG: 2OG-Fe(II) oxygenase [Gammaproteobacteria bacterium]|nr:2OG-Fe(II) oxygenase [Gammaproteobacteria bacterium]
MKDFIGVYDDALSAEQCSTLIARFNTSDKVVRGHTGHGVDIAKKDSYDIMLNKHAEWQDAAQLIATTTLNYLREYMREYSFLLMGALSATVVHPKTGQPVVLDPENFAECGEPHLTELVQTMYRCGSLNMQKYLAGTGGYHHWHSETYPQNASCETLHRVLLFQYYLNDVAEGGETDFYYQERKITPKAGRLIIAPAGFTHTHKGCVPRSGDKYVITSWILFQRAETLYGKPPAG